VIEKSKPHSSIIQKRQLYPSVELELHRKYASILEVELQQNKDGILNVVYEYLTCDTFEWKRCMDGLSKLICDKKNTKDVIPKARSDELFLISATNVTIDRYSNWTTLQDEDELDVHAVICHFTGVRNVPGKFSGTGIPPRVMKTWNSVVKTLCKMMGHFKTRGLDLNGDVTAEQIGAVNP
jgi:hypothetical protein